VLRADRVRPLSLTVYLAVDRMAGTGRSVFVKLIWHSRE
jgi:hypothetical protein